MTGPRPEQKRLEGHVLRLVAVSLVTGASFFGVYVFLSLQGSAGGSGGWLLATAWLAPAGALACTLLFWRRQRVIAVVGTAVIVLAAAVFGGILAHVSAPDPARLRTVLASVELPDDLHMESELERAGSCFGGCPFYVRDYTTPRPSRDVITDVVAAFSKAGFRLDPVDDGGDNEAGAGGLVIRGNRGRKVALTIEIARFYGLSNTTRLRPYRVRVKLEGHSG